MTYTLEQVITVLVTRYNDIISEVGWPTDVDTNAKIEQPIGWAFRIMGNTQSDLTAISDSDIATIEATDIDELLDMAEYRLLWNLVGNIPEVDVRIGHRQEEFSQLANRMIQLLDRKRTEVRQLYGYGLAILETGTLDLDYVTTEDDDNVGI